MDWVPKDKQMDMRQPDAGLLDWIKENPAEAVAVGAITPYAAKELSAAAARPLQKAISARSSIKIDKFYSKGANKAQLAMHHFLKNEQDEINKIVKKWYPDLKNLKYADKKRELSGIAKQFGVTITPDPALNRAKGSFGELTAVLERKDLIAKGISPDERGWQARKLRGLDLDIRSEHQWQVLNKVVHDDIKSLSRADKIKINKAGLTAPIKTNMKNVFGGKNFGSGKLNDHSRAIVVHGKQMQSPNTAVSISKVINSGDAYRMHRAVSKDHLNQMAEYVMKYADLDNPDKIARLESIRKHAQQKFFSMAATPMQYASLHWEVGNADKSIQQFMQRFRYNEKTGIGRINISPSRKPLPLIGGFNANIRYQKVKTKPRYRLINNKGFASGQKTPDMFGEWEKYYPNKIKKSYLYTDRLDLLKGSGWTQKLPHLSIMTKEDVSRVTNREKMITSLKEKNWRKAATSAAKLAGKLPGLAGRFFAFRFARI